MERGDGEFHCNTTIRWGRCGAELMLLFGNVSRYAANDVEQNLHEIEVTVPKP